MRVLLWYTNGKTWPFSWFNKTDLAVVNRFSLLAVKIGKVEDMPILNYFNRLQLCPVLQLGVGMTFTAQSSNWKILEFLNLEWTIWNWRLEWCLWLVKQQGAGSWAGAKCEKTHPRYHPHSATSCRHGYWKEGQKYQNYS